MPEHLTHHDDCGCLSGRHAEVFCDAPVMTTLRSACLALVRAAKKAGINVREVSSE